MAGLLHHAVMLPVLLPLVTGAVLLFFDERRHWLKAAVSLSSAGLLVLVCAVLIWHAGMLAPLSDVYLLGNWAAPFGIVLVLDRLSAVLLLMSSVLGFFALVFAMAHWHKAGSHFYSLMQFLMVGINGAFLTGDIFNLFVFFEVMLTASYVLLMHGSGIMRVRAGMHYVVINLIASLCFLVGAAVIYGVVGTLNMADLAYKLPRLGADEQVLFQVGASIIAVVFLIKAGMWPLGFWMPFAYSSTAAPVGAVFAVLSKVGIYAILRLSLLVFGAQGSSFYKFGNELMFYGGLITIVFGIVGILSSPALARLAANCVLISLGTALAAIATGNAALTGAAVYYVISSTFALGAFFLLVELVERSQDAAANVLAVTMEVYGDDEVEEEDEVGIYIPSTLAILGGCFCICAILNIGMPPFSGFLAKFMLIAGLFQPGGTGHAGVSPAAHDWFFAGLVILSGLASLIAMMRAGIRAFWASIESTIPKVQMIEVIPVAGLLFLCFVLTVAVEPVMRYLEAMASGLHRPADYISSVLGSFPGHEGWRSP